MKIATCAIKTFFFSVKSEDESSSHSLNCRERDTTDEIISQ